MRIKCANCKKELTKDMDIEYSEWLCEYFCSPDCATDRYYEYCASRPLRDDEKARLMTEKGD